MPIRRLGKIGAVIPTSRRSEWQKGAQNVVSRGSWGVNRGRGSEEMVRPWPASNAVSIPSTRQGGHSQITLSGRAAVSSRFWVLRRREWRTPCDARGIVAAEEAN